MKDQRLVVNPFRIISPKLDAEASRLAELYESPPEEVTCLEEGLLVMISKLLQMTELLYKSFVMPDPDKIKTCETLGAEIHNEEKDLTTAIVCSPRTTDAVLKTILLFPGKLERAGDLLESMLNVAKIKARDGIAFSDKAQAELAQLFDLLRDMIRNFRDLVSTLNPTLLEVLLSQQKQLAQMTLDFALTHEDRLISGLCSPKASSLYLDILDSVRNINRHFRDMTEAMQRLSTMQLA
jgi:Na+/phosphate symporter